MTTPVYAVTGASGRLGRLVVEQLTARGVPRRISSPWSARRLRPSASPRPACRCARRTIPGPRPCLPLSPASNRLLLVSGSEIGHLVPQHTNVIEAAMW
jgi:NAD(P)H dehydrogenase (quinone)